MAKNLKGITIKIGADTQDLNSALRNVDKQVYGLNGDLKALNQALKLDPKNTELLAQKQDVLKRNIEATTQRLDMLNEAQQQLGDYSSLTDEQKTKYNQLSGEIAKAEQALQSMNSELSNSNKIDLSKVTSALKKVGEVAVQVAKKVAQITAAFAGAVAGVVTLGVKEYAKLEVAQKGSERLFGKSYKIVQQNAKSAYKSLGLSAGEYYDQVNQYAVGLKNALGGDTKAAAELSDGILKAQADIVAATGADQSAVQNAFAAVMRGNYTMLDNLRLGIKGSKQGMEEVIDKVNEWNKAHGDAKRYQMGNYADMEAALVKYTEVVKVAGTSQDQMSKTIQGSVQQLKAAWTNFLTGEGSPEDVEETLTNALKNILKAVKKLAPSILNGLVQLGKDMIPELINGIMTGVPTLLQTAFDILMAVVNSISENIEPLANMAITIISNIVKFITDNLPLLLNASLQIIMALAKGIIDNLPQLIGAVLSIIAAIVEWILDNIDKIVDLGIDIMMALIEGLIEKGIPLLVEKAPEIVFKLIKTVIKLTPELLTLGFKILKAIIKGLINALPDKAKEVVQDIIDKIKEKIKELWEDIKSIGSFLIDGIVAGAKAAGKAIKGVGSWLVGKVKDVLGIHSPSRVARDEIGYYFGEGLVDGILKGIEDTEIQVKDAMTQLGEGINASMNPTINPTANTNPLILQIENFYNNRDTDIQKLAEELEFYRKRSATAKGGN